MSTATLTRPQATIVPPDWRRVCHYYEGDEQISICGTARRIPGEDHSEAECAERGHTVCVVCEALV